jgi:hypothetical protein
MPLPFARVVTQPVFLKALLRRREWAPFSVAEPFRFQKSLKRNRYVFRPCWFKVRPSGDRGLVSRGGLACPYRHGPGWPTTSTNQRGEW